MKNLPIIYAICLSALCTALLLLTFLVGLEHQVTNEGVMLITALCLFGYLVSMWMLSLVKN